MTALKPIENVQGVHGVPSTRYPLNTVCAVPGCTEPVGSAHHIFNRKIIGNDSWFVKIETDLQEADSGPLGDANDWKPVTIIRPHVTGLCGSGTTGHHGDVEEHRAWIKLENGVFVWYDRTVPQTDPHANEPGDLGYQTWIEVGPLNPQPGSVEGKTKRRKPKATTPEERRARKVTSIKTPVGEENVLAETLELIRHEPNWEKVRDVFGWTESVPDYYVVFLALSEFYKALRDGQVTIEVS